ncbi:hypothetical protein C6A87_004535 [Mycobacterium sp. ITM-2016-00317]|uniref:hypothetical protein n=1 Tax=Mycobacterium sp. ITM-2016-00317 TaxID=2099694 RepID=UPI00287FEFB2|nr:hypothetical protein [Mycobacterium sp. ITM-2016-00317]WNG88515.1 hypothetical protein C6A87_004535 [Mycobacterium sp. ITM-2016-00317]
MTPDSEYEIARFSVSTDEEVLIERAQLFRADGRLRYSLGNGPAIDCSVSDTGVVIGSNAALSEIRANQVTRITAKPAVLQELPFLLRVVGDRDEFDDELWSESMFDEHVTKEWEVQPGLFRVLYANGERWSAWPTTQGDRMLPEDWPLVRLKPRWASLSFCENDSMTSGVDETAIGEVSPVAVACATLMDPHNGGGVDDVVLRRRGTTPMDDAQMFVRWLLDGGLVPHYSADDDLKAMLAQLFVQASTGNSNGFGVPGSQLAAGAGTALGLLDSDSSEWTLELDLPPEVIDAVLDVLANRGPRIRDIVTAARDPSSPAGIAQRDALQEWSEQFSEKWSKYYESQRRRQEPTDYNVGDTFADPREGQSVLWLSGYKLETDESDTWPSFTSWGQILLREDGKLFSRALHYDDSYSDWQLINPGPLTVEHAKRYYRGDPDYQLYEPREDPFAVL